MKIAIVDSGINSQYFEDIEIKQYKVENGIIEKEIPIDYIGHGTSMLHIILHELVNMCEIISFRPVIVDNRLNNIDIYTAIKSAIEMNCNLINISMGNRNFNHREKIDKICEEAYQKGIIIVCAFSKKNEVILPWACQNTVKVIQGKENSGDIQLIKTNYGVSAISVEKAAFRTIDIDGNKKLLVGHSAAAAFITGRIAEILKKNENNGIHELFSRYVCNERIEEMIRGYVRIDEKIELGKRGTAKKYLKAVLVPFTKEMESLLNFDEYTEMNIVAGVEFGSVRHVYESQFSGKRIDIINDLEKLEDYNPDLIVIGYLDKIEKIYKEITIDNILGFAIRHKCDLYSFQPLDEEVKKKCDQNELRYFETIKYNEKFLKEIRKNVPFTNNIQFPILGVFGTSSKQGKFTLQMLIRREFDRRKINYAFLSTEHQAQFMNTDICFPYGYGTNLNNELCIENNIEIIQKLIYYIEQSENPDTMLVGGQSWLIPYNIETQAAVYNLAFLDAIKPDFSILVVNPEIDNMQYIRDTIICLTALFKCKVIALAFSDRKVIKKTNIVYKVRRTPEDIKNTAQLLYGTYGIVSGCIADNDFIKSVVDLYLENVE